MSQTEQINKTKKCIIVCKFVYGRKLRVLYVFFIKQGPLYANVNNYILLLLWILPTFVIMSIANVKFNYLALTRYQRSC